MPGGLLPLVAYGNMNQIINGNPQMTYFYKAFVRHTHFSQENITVPLDGPNELLLDAPIQLRAKIPRHGDLLSDMYLTFQLPAIYNKLWTGRGSHEFAWIRQVGLRIIDRVGLYIGGTKVQEYSSDFLAAKYQMDLPIDTFEKWSNLIGDVPELYAPASGAYADPSGGYPNVVPFPTITTQTNAPSIPRREINVPLGFFFSDSPGLALPLVGLQYHDVEVQITLRPMRQLYTILDPSGCRVQPGYRLDSPAGTNIYANSWPPEYGPLPEALNNNYQAYYDVSGTPHNFYTDAGYGIPASDGFPMNPRLQCTYIYLTDNERKLFASKKLEYLVRQVQEFQFPNITTRQQLQIDAHSLVSRMFWFARRSDWSFRNDYTNLTNWKYTDPHKRPYVRFQNTTQTSGGLITGAQRNILRTARILCGGNEIFEEKKANYFSDIVPYKSNAGGGYPYLLGGLLQPLALYPLYAYSFALSNSSATQPSGTINTSRITKVDLEVDVEPLPADANYSYDFSVYVESLNFLEIQSGMGGMRYAI
jgi:Major capsid protein N-terminus/Large eukaryotic DNA virus major capsid protein